jgi:outer membrane protein assembly factor BamD (BamD/ComL family)
MKYQFPLLKTVTLLLTLLAVEIAPIQASPPPEGNETVQTKRALGTSGFALRKGKVINKKDVPWLTVQEHYSLGKDSFESGNYDEAAKHFRVVVANYLDSPFGQDSLYFCAASFYHVGELEKANIAATEYLSNQSNLKYFEDVLELKLAIGEKYSNGARKHLFGMEKLPKWSSGSSEGVAIYNEIIATIPSHPFAAKAYFAKGMVHKSEREWKEAVDNFQSVINKFPKHDLTPVCYKEITSIYLARAKSELNNPDLLAQAEVHVNKFRIAFPSDPAVAENETQFLEMQEVYANGLFKTAKFYERTKKPKAAVLYYHVALKQFPKTETAALCKERLDELHDVALELNLVQDISL